MGVRLGFGWTGSVYGWGPRRLVEAGGELGYEEALSRRRLEMGAVCCVGLYVGLVRVENGVYLLVGGGVGTSENESLFSN